VRDFDVAIVGGGLVGASLALGLAGTGVRMLLIEGVAPDSAAQPSFDERTTALGNASRRIFQGLGIWDEVARDAAAIRAIHVSDAGRFGFARLHATEHGIDAFGYVVPNRVIGAALWRRLSKADGVEIRVPASIEALDITMERAYFRVTTSSGVREVSSARLLVAADGAHSAVRAAAGIEAGVEDYDQVAIAAAVTGDRAHDGTAYERFTPCGPVAVLPLRGGGYGTIWSCTPQRAAQLLAMDDAAYLQELQNRFGWRAGRFRRIGSRASYPLKLTRAAATVARRTVLIGNAAQALHPIAGQGFNLGLRDAALLAEVIAGAAGDVGCADPG
jgi:2-octaprenyl-6-methoxyphenol hydroxylase